MNEEDVKRNGQEPFCVDEFRPEDAEGIVSLFRAVYGDGYPIRLFYDPEAIVGANRDGSYYSVVARTPGGRVVGACHLYRSAPYAGLYENGVSLVAREYRNSKIFKELLSYVFNEYIPQKPHIAEVWGEAVCNHLISQKMMFPFLFVETALEVALMPGEAYAHEQSAAGRVATLDAFRCYIPKPHRIYLPPIYEAMLRRIYDRLGSVRDIAIADKIFPANKITHAELSVFDFARVARMAVFKSGGDFADCLAQMENRARKQNAVVFQVWLNLTEPCVGQAVDILRDRGYFFGGALPRWFDGDGLLMQKLECPPDFDNIVLWSDFSRELLAFIRKDWDDCAG